MVFVSGNKALNYGAYTNNPAWQGIRGLDQPGRTIAKFIKDSDKGAKAKTVVKDKKPEDPNPTGTAAPLR